MKQAAISAVAPGHISRQYLKYTSKKVFITSGLVLMTMLLGVYAINAGSAELTPWQVVMALMGQAEANFDIVIWQIRLPRVLSSIVAGTGLSVAGCVMQSILRNPLASPFTLGISQGAAFGAAIGIIMLGAGSTHSSSIDAVIIGNPYLVSMSAFFWAMLTTLVIVLLAKYKGVSPEGMVLAGVALGSLFAAGTIILQYFASDVQVASIVFWTFGDVGRSSWRDLEIMTVVIGLSMVYFIKNSWNYNSLDNGTATALSLGVDVEKLRLKGMFLSSMITAVVVSFMGIIGFIGLVGPHLMRRLIGGDHRFLLPASCMVGGLLLLAADTLGRTLVAPVVLPVGAITSFMGAPLFLYLLCRGNKKI